MPRDSEKAYELAATFSRTASEILGVSRSIIDELLVAKLKSGQIPVRAIVHDLRSPLDEDGLRWQTYQEELEALTNRTRDLVRFDLSEWHVLTSFLPVEGSIRRRGLADEHSNIILYKKHKPAEKRVLVSAMMLVEKTDEALKSRFAWAGLKTPRGLQKSVKTWSDIALVCVELDRRGWFEKGHTIANFGELIRASCEHIDSRQVDEIAEYIFRQFTETERFSH